MGSRAWAGRKVHAAKNNSANEDLDLVHLLEFYNISSTFTKTYDFPFMPDSKAVEVEGKIVTVLPGTMFRVQLDNGHTVLAHISGRLRKHFIKIATGDRVKMEMSAYDLGKARITFRLRGTNVPPTSIYARRGPSRR